MEGGSQVEAHFQVVDYPLQCTHQLPWKPLQSMSAVDHVCMGSWNNFDAPPTVCQLSVVRPAAMVRLAPDG